MNSIYAAWTYITISPQEKHRNIERNNDKVIIEGSSGVELDLK